MIDKAIDNKQPEPFEPHPNLSDEINNALIESELQGGCRFDEFPDGCILNVYTRNTHYQLKKSAGKEFIKGHAKYCPDWTECLIAGSTFGGSMLKMRFIGVGMHMEFSRKEHFGRLLTSEIQRIEV